jgi:hypothetical protein
MDEEMVFEAWKGNFAHTWLNTKKRSSNWNRARSSLTGNDKNLLSLRKGNQLGMILLRKSHCRLLPVTAETLGHMALVPSATRAIVQGDSVISNL